MGKRIIKTMFILTALICTAFIFKVKVSADDAVPTVEITNSTPVVNEPLQITSSNITGDVTYQWYKDDQLVSSEETYTPTTSDYESWIKVEIIQEGTVVCYDSIYFSKLPVLYINTDDGQAITSKEEYKTGTMLTQGNSQYSDSSQLYSGVIEIKGRGNSTWILPKKPYKIKLDSKCDLFGMGANKHWVLLANYYDESLMRNKIVYDFSSQLGIVSMSSTWVDVVLNGEYVGNYQLCEHIRIGDTRVDIYNWEDTAADIASAVYKAEKANGLTKTDKSNIEDALCEDFSWVTSGVFTYNGNQYTIANYYTDESFSSSTNLAKGYLFELSEEYDELTKFTTSSGLKVMVNSPEYLYTNSDMYSYTKNLWQSYEDAYMSTTGYNSDGTYYTSISDLDSMASYWLTLEIFGNNDASRKSRYAYLDDDGLIKWGPVWDCDWGVGSAQVGNIPTGWKVSHGNPYKYFITHDDFLETVIAKYQEIRPQLVALISDGGTFDQEYSYIYESGVANDALWKNSRGFTGDVSELKSYLTQRVAWLDSQFSDLDTLKSSLGLTTTSYTTAYNPVGAFENVSIVDGKVSVTGWAYDPDDSSKSIDVRIYIDSTVCLGSLTTTVDSSDINSKYGITGAHRFTGTFSTALTGSHTITLRAINLGSADPYKVDTATIYIPTGTNANNPKGCFDGVAASSGKVSVWGWAYDPDSPNTSIDIKVYAGSTLLGTIPTDSARSDVNSAYNISGIHGYCKSLTTTLSGTYTITIKAVDANSGSEYTIGSKSVTIPSSSTGTTATYTTKYNPKANVEAVTPSVGQIKIAGWAYDPDDASKSIDIKAYIGTTCLGTLSANIARSDVNKAFGITGDHGFSGYLKTTLTGTQTITIKAVNLGSGEEYTISTKSITIPSSSTGTTTTYTTKYNPKANVEAVTPSVGQIKIAGWAYDPDDASKSIDIKAYIGTTCLGTLSANIARSDVNKAFGITGDHGFSGYLKTTLTGTQTITIKAVNLGSGEEYTISTKSITIPTSSTDTTTTYTTKYNPKGCFDGVAASSGKVSVWGWAYDPDSSSTSIDVKVYAGSTLLGTIPTDSARADVNSAYGITGTHGYCKSVTTTLSGTYTITIKAVNVGSGVEYTIGSKTVTIPSSSTTTTYTTKYTPKGSVDALKALGSGKVYAGGWAFDQDSVGTNVAIKMYVGSTLIGTGTTSFTRSDVNGAYGITGTHGFDLTCTTTLRGTYTVTIKAVDLQTNTEYTIGSKSITIS